MTGAVVHLNVIAVLDQTWDAFAVAVEPLSD